MLSPLTLGGLKTSQQKTVRFGAARVGLPPRADGSILSAPSQVFACMACALMFSNAGTFSPELQLFTRGVTSALKRTMVIVLEDAWVQNPPVLALVASSVS